MIRICDFIKCPMGHVKKYALYELIISILLLLEFRYPVARYSIAVLFIVLLVTFQKVKNHNNR